MRADCCACIGGVLRAFDFWASVSVVMLLAVWLVYPLVMGVLASWARRGVRRTHAPADVLVGSVSVVVATRDGASAVRS